MKRTRNHSDSYKFEYTEPVSGNYFPVNSRIITSDGEKALTILNDRSQGGSSLADGQLELMLHRRCFFDDHWGVDEALNETGADGRGLITRGKQWLVLSPVGNAARMHRPLAFEMFYEPVISYAPLDRTVENYKQNFVTQFSPLTVELPAGVNLLTLKQIGEKELLYSVGGATVATQNGAITCTNRTQRSDPRPPSLTESAY